MAQESFMNKMRWFFGLHQQPPKNEFRNPIWGSDDDDDGDELYSRQPMDAPSHMDLHQEITRHMHDMVRSFGGIFGDVKFFFNDDIKSFFESDNNPDFNYAGSVPELPTDSEKFSSNSIRDYYLKPGYHNRHLEHQDVDLDGKISSQEISGLLKKQEEGNENNSGMGEPFNGAKVPGRSFCRTIITTSVTKPDGTTETRKIVKNGNEIIEESTTSSGPDTQGPHSPNPGLSTISSTGILLNELATLFQNFY